MAQKTLKFDCIFTLMADHYLGYGYAEIVIADTRGYKAEKVECPYMGFKEGLGAFPGKGHHEHGIGMNQAHYKEYDLFQ